MHALCKKLFSNSILFSVFSQMMMLNISILISLLYFIFVICVDLMKRNLTYSSRVGGYSSDNKHEIEANYEFQSKSFTISC